MEEAGLLIMEIIIYVLELPSLAQNREAFRISVLGCRGEHFPKECRIAKATRHLMVLVICKKNSFRAGSQDQQ